MLKIKLARFGKRNQPHYRIVVNKAREKRDGRYIAQVGHYSPAQTPKVLEIDVAAYKTWLKNGAQPTPTVAALFKRYQSGNPFPPKKQQLSRKAKAKLAKPAEEKVEAEKPAEQPAEAPTEKAAEKPVAPATEAQSAEKPAETPAAEAKVEEPAK